MLNQIEESIDKKNKESIEDINTIALARIERVDNVNLEADISLISMSEFNGEYDEDIPYVNVPIMPIFNSSSFFVNAPYNKGDLVLVAFCQHSLQGTLDEFDQVEPLSYDQYSKDDAFIIGNITARYQNSSSEDFSIVHKESGNYIKLTSSGKIEIQGDVNITGNLNVSGESEATDHISSGISGKDHKHGGVTKGADETEVPK